MTIAEATRVDPPAATSAPAPEGGQDGDAGLASSVLELPLAQLRPSDPLRWIRLGWADFRRCPRIGLFYGLCFFLMGHALLLVFQSAPAYVMALSAGFLLMGPFLCLGLYDASKALQTPSRQPSLRASMLAWQPAKGTMAIFAGLLLILTLLWGRASMVVFAVSFTTVPAVEKLWLQLLHPENIGFLLTYSAVAGVFAGLVFAISVVSIPMIMDRQVDAISAGLTSIRACLKNPGVMLIWGALITLLIGLAMLPVFLGLLVIGPVIGHATWHAYQHIVPASSA